MAVLTLLAALAASAQTGGSAHQAITVTGHQWAPFISPMGEPFRARSASDNTFADWFTQADRNHDGSLTPDEMVADAERFFATLDTNRDGEIDPDELAQYEYEIAPEIQVMSRTKRAPGEPPSPAVRNSDDPTVPPPKDDRQRKRREADIDSSLALGGALQGAGRYALLDIPEPVAAADTDFNRGVTLAEFKAAALARFQLLDKNKQGRLTLAGLQALLPGPADKRRKRDLDAPDRRIGNPLPPGS